MPRPRKTQETPMPGGEMPEPAKGTKTTAKSEMPGADMNVPVAEEMSAAGAGTSGALRGKTSARKPAARKRAAKKPAAKRKTGGGK